MARRHTPATKAKISRALKGRGRPKVKQVVVGSRTVAIQTMLDRKYKGKVRYGG